MQLSFIKTTEDALAAVNAYPVPVAGDKATAEQKASVDRQAALVTEAKTFMASRIRAVPTDVKIVSVEIRAEAGPLEMFTYRIVNHT